MNAEEEVLRTRRDDGLVYRWMPAIVTVITVGIAWGTLTAKVGRLDAAANDGNVERRMLRDQGIRLEAQLARLNEVLAENKVAVALVRELSSEAGRLGAKVERNSQHLDDLWELARENQSNVDVIAASLRKDGAAVTLTRRARPR